MRGVDVGAYGGEPLAEHIRDALGTAALYQRDHRRGREHPQRAAAHSERRVLYRDGYGLCVFDSGLDLGHSGLSFLGNSEELGVRSEE